MSSSYRLKRRIEDSDQFSFGKWDEHYIRPVGECAPGYASIATIGSNYGPKVCKRIVYENSLEKRNECKEMNIKGSNSPYYPYVKKYDIPNEQDLVQKGYLYNDQRYDGLGFDIDHRRHITPYKNMQCNIYTTTHSFM